jgi:ribosome maturation factor RimP
MGGSPIFCLWRGIVRAWEMGAEPKDVIEQTVTGMGYEFVDLELVNRGRFVRVYIDKPSQVGGVNADDCEAVSKQLSRVFEVENIDYDRLEISSPGLDRKLKKPADFVRFGGQIAQLRLRVPQEGRRNLTGILREMRDGSLGIEVEGKMVTVALDNLEKARLVPKI